MEFCKLGRDNLRQWGERFWQKFKESWRLRAAVFFALSACAVMALFALSDSSDGQEQIALSAGSLEREGAAKQAASLPIRGSSRALDREKLRNPFLAEHPAEGQRQLGQETDRGKVTGRGRLPDSKGNAGAARGQAAAGQVQAAASAGQMAGQAGDGKDGQEKDGGLQLQGIIHAGDGTGALVLAGGKSRLLLAGEAWSGICLERVEQDEAVVAVNGHERRLGIGDRLA